MAQLLQAGRTDEHGAVDRRTAAGTDLWGGSDSWLRYFVFVKSQTAVGTNGILYVHLGTTARTEQIELHAAGWARGGLCLQRRATFRAERLSAGWAFRRMSGHGLATGRALAAKQVPAAGASRLVRKDPCVA